MFAVPAWVKKRVIKLLDIRLANYVSYCCTNMLQLIFDFFFNKTYSHNSKVGYLGECTVGLFKLIIYDRRSIHLMSVGTDKLELTGRTIDI